MLEQLSKQDSKWRAIALKITGDKNTADDVVNEMYLRRFDNNRGQQLTDYYIICTMRSIYLNSLKTNKYIPVEEIRIDEEINEQFEPNDFENDILTKANSLTFKDKELLELSYEMSLREIQNKFGINYGYVYKTVKNAREKILGDNIGMYNNKRLKHMKKSEGLGDTIKKITEVTGIKRLVDILVGEDCGCEKRRKYLNEVFKYKLTPRCLEPDEIKAYENFINNRRINIKSTNYATGKISKEEVIFLYDFFNHVFSTQRNYPTCTSCAGAARETLDMIIKLDLVYANNVDDKKKKAKTTKVKPE